MPNPPEGCKLIAHNTGDGWYLGIQDRQGNEVAMLDWPASWPESVNATFLRQCGFQVV